MLTEAQWQQYEHKTARTGFFVQKRGEQSFWIVDQHGRHYGEPFTDHETAVAHFLTTTYTPLTVRVDTCVQHGAKNKPQWARKTQAKGREISMEPRQFSACYEPLTAAEMRIVHAICAGYTSYSEMAEATGRKPRTIATHLSTIYGKLGVRNTAALVLYALRAGWFDEYGRQVVACCSN